MDGNPGRPVVAMMCGLPGSGKTELAKHLEDELPAVSLDLDSWAISLFGQSPPREVLHNGLIRLKDLQWTTAQQILSRNMSVVLDFGFWKRAERLEFARRARAAGARPVLYYLAATKVDLLERLAERNANLPSGTYEVTPEMLEIFIGRFEVPEADEGIEMSV